MAPSTPHFVWPRAPYARMVHVQPLTETHGGAALTTVTNAIAQKGDVARNDAWYPVEQRDRFIVQQLVSKDFKLKYRRSILGVAWSVLNPLLMMCVMAAVFTRMMRFSSEGIPSYPLYIILGNITFALMSDSTSQGMVSIIEASSLLKKVKIDRWVFPVEKVLFAIVNVAFSLVAVLLVMVIVHLLPTWTALMLPLFVVYLGLFCIGVSMLLATAAVFFRDVIHLWSVVLTAWTYFTPLFYPEEILPELVLKLERFNPMYHYVGFIRELLLYQRLPTLGMHVVCGGFAVLALAVGWFVFRRHEHKFILFI